MGDEAKDTSAVPPVSQPSIMELIRSTVKEELKSSGTEVRESLIQNLTEQEIKRRTDAATKVFEKIEATEAEIKKIRPTHAGYDLKGNGVGEPTYTKEQAESSKKAHELLARLTGALTKALTDGDFSKVFEAAK